MPAQYVKKIDTGLSASQQSLVNQNSIAGRQNQIERLYGNLLELANRRKDKLEESCKAYRLVREAEELAQWIKEVEQHAQGNLKLLLSKNSKKRGKLIIFFFIKVKEVGENLEQVEVHQKRFDDFRNELKANEVILNY